MMLYYLGATLEYRTLANLFDVSTSYVCLCIKDVSEAITRKLQFCSVLNDQDLKALQRKVEIPGIHRGYRWHPHSFSSSTRKSHWLCQQKSYHSIIIQAMVDSRYLCQDVVTGCPGTVHVAWVLSNSELYNCALQAELFGPIIKEAIPGLRSILLFLVTQPTLSEIG